MHRHYSAAPYEPHSVGARYYQGGSSGSGQWMTQYVRRLWSWDQMDFDSCFDQMISLLGPPKNMVKVYKLANYRKKTKNQWARDDPAFVLVQVGFLSVSSLAWGIVCLRNHLSLGRFILLLARELFVQWLLGGLIISVLGATIANRHLIEHSVHSVAQTVEWLYAFDIHCNGFFIAFQFTHVLQLFLLPLLVNDGLMPTLFANLLWAVALALYFFVSHLGYRALPFLKNTEIYLYPIIAIFAAYVALAVVAFLGYRINITQIVTSFYSLKE